MGCDIHFYVECDEGGTGDWMVANDPDPNAKWGGWYAGRNYDLFAILADVRNGVGFAGIDTGESFIPIATPRGLPIDVSNEVRRQSDEYGIDGHSHTFLTVAEILAYDYDQTTKHRAYFDGEALAKAKRFLDHGWALDDIYPRAGWSSNGEPLTWESAYRRSLDGEWWSCVQKMARLAIQKCDGDLRCVRAVFWFDN